MDTKEVTWHKQPATFMEWIAMFNRADKARKEIDNHATDAVGYFMQCKGAEGGIKASEITIWPSYMLPSLFPAMAKLHYEDFWNRTYFPGSRKPFIQWIIEYHSINQLSYTCTN